MIGRGKVVKTVSNEALASPDRNCGSVVQFESRQKKQPFGLSRFAAHPQTDFK